MLTRGSDAIYLLAHIRAGVLLCITDYDDNVMRTIHTLPLRLREDKWGLVIVAFTEAGTGVFSKFIVYCFYFSALDSRTSSHPAPQVRNGFDKNHIGEMVAEPTPE